MERCAQAEAALEMLRDGKLPLLERLLNETAFESKVTSHSQSASSSESSVQRSVRIQSSLQKDGSLFVSAEHEKGASAEDVANYTRSMVMVAALTYAALGLDMSEFRAALGESPARLK